MSRRALRLYDAAMRPVGELRAAEITDLKLRMIPLSTAMVSVPTRELGEAGFRTFIELVDAGGRRIDLFRVSEAPQIERGEAGMALRTRVTEVVYPRPIEEPGNAQLTLATQTRDVATVIAELTRRSYESRLYGQGSTFIFADSVEQNADADTPAEGDIYIPENMIHVNAVRLKVKLMAYRADSRGAADGGGTTRTTSAGGQATRTSSAGGGATLTVEARTAAQAITSGSPMADGAAAADTGYAKAYDGGNMASTGSASGTTGSGDPTATGAARNADGAISSTGSATAGGTVGDNSAVSGYTEPGTSSNGSHSHTVNSHTHNASTTHRHTVNDTYTSYNSPGATASASPGTGSGGSHSHSVDSHCHTMNHGHSFTGSAHSHSMGHWHAMDAHTHSVGSHSHDMTHRHEHNHYHLVNVAVTVPGQTLEVPSHSHSVDIPDHSHSVTLENHTHGIDYGIYKGPRASAFTVEIDGVAVPAEAFDARGEGDIAPYLAKDEDGRIKRGHFHTLAVRPAETEGNPKGLCRVRASWNAQVFISSLVGVQY